jgi:hypothetical protein
MLPITKDIFRALFIVFPTCFFIASCVRSLDRAADARKLLDNRQTDSVTAAPLPEVARVATADQSVIVESSHFAIGEERKLDGSVTPIFARSDYHSLLMVAQNTPPSPPGAPLPAAPVGEAPEMMVVLVTDLAPLPEVALVATADQSVIVESSHFAIGEERKRDAKVADVRKFLNDKELDSVTAGGVRIDLELSADAEGPTAVTSTQGSIRTTRTTVLLLAMDPSAPEPARARLLGVSAAELAFAAGKADAAGTIDVQCSAAPTGVGDAMYVAQSRTVTAISATCSCSAFGIGVTQ